MHRCRTYYEPVPSRELAPADYAHVLERLHDCMRQIEFPTPHFTDRITDAQRGPCRGCFGEYLRADGEHQVESAVWRASSNTNAEQG